VAVEPNVIDGDDGGGGDDVADIVIDHCVMVINVT